MSMISGIIGCKVYKKGDADKKVIGKIIGCHKDSEDYLYFLILTPNGTLTDRDYYSLCIIPEDMNIVYRELKAEPIESRAEILDL